MALQRTLLFAPLLAAALAAGSSAQVVGGPFEGHRIESLVFPEGAPAQSFDELAGRLILVEFFAYW